MRKLFLALERGLLLMLFAHPALLWLCKLVFPGRPCATLLCELLCLTAGLALSLLRVKRKKRLAMLTMLLEAALIALLPLPWPGKLALLPFLPLTALLCRDAMASVLEGRCVPFVMCGYALYAVCAIVTRAGYYPQALGRLCYMGALAYLPVSLVLLNESALRVASPAARGVAATRRIAAGNRALTYGFALLVVAVVYVREIRSALDRAGVALLAALRAVAAFLLRIMASLMPGLTEGPPPEGGDMGFGMGEHVEPSALALFMERLALVLAAVLALALAGFLLWTLGRKLLRALRAWWSALRESWMATDVGYEDETTTTLRFRDDDGHTRARARRRRKRPDWNAMTPEARVRYVAGRIMERKEHLPSDTPRALLAPDEPELLEGYEIARYSSLPVSDRQAAVAEELYRKR